MLKLQALELSKSYRGRKVVDDVELEIGQGEVVGLLGPNGAGKTTTVRAIMGAVRPATGSIRLDGAELTQLPPHAVAARGWRPGPSSTWPPSPRYARSSWPTASCASARA